tara:strand:+ start:585 stop:2069 length:1485 start_codon:yes stop_codon:yes gene_type:complete
MRNKINFYSLEQFILADAQALQAQVFDYQDDVVRGLIGENTHGALSRITRKSYNSTTETLILNPFRAALQGRIMLQDEDIPIQFSSIDTLANAYYTTNNTMVGFPLVNIYARVAEEIFANETRNFWSPIDQAAIQQEVDTRTKITMDIKAAFSTPAAVGGFEYKKIASIAEDGWLVSVDINSGVERVSPQTITTSFAFNNYFASIRVAPLISEGLRGPFFALESAIDNLLRNGVNDPAGLTDTSPMPGGQPTLSIQGLAAFVGNSIHKVRARIHLSATANINWPTGQEVDFNNLTTVQPYTEIFQITDGTANPDAIGFTGDCFPHSFDDAYWALPFDVPEVLQSTGSLGSGADVNMYMIVDDLNSAIDGPDDGTITVNTTFGTHNKQGFNCLWGFVGTHTYGGPISLLNQGGGIAWSTGGQTNVSAVTFYTNLTQAKANNNVYDEMIRRHFINYNGRVIDGYQDDENGIPQPQFRDTPTYIALPTIRWVCTIKA